VRATIDHVPISQKSSVARYVESRAGMNQFAGWIKNADRKDRRSRFAHSLLQFR
jgi:hypothetical protein